MIEDFRKQDGKTDYRTLCLYLFVRREIPMSLLQYQFAGDMVKCGMFEKYFKTKRDLPHEAVMDACADHVMGLWSEWSIDKDAWYEKYGEGDRLDAVLDELTKLNN